MRCMWPATRLSVARRLQAKATRKHSPKEQLTSRAHLQQLFNVLGYVHGIGGRGISVDGHALLVHQKLGEVPLDSAAQGAGLLGL